MNCKKCGIRLNDDWASCPACGTPKEQEKLCAKCGFKLNEDWKNCPGCGAPVEKDIFCDKCGCKLEKSWNTCPACGTAVAGKKFCAHCGRGLEENWHICPTCGREINEKAPEEEFKHNIVEETEAETRELPEEELPTSEESFVEEEITEEETVEEAPVELPKKKMKWHKFLVSFGIWAALIASVAVFFIGLSDWLSDFFWVLSSGDLEKLIYTITDAEYIKLSVFSIIDFAAVLIVIATASVLIKKKRATRALVILTTLLPIIIFAIKQLIEAVYFIGMYGAIPMGVISVAAPALSVFLMLICAVVQIIFALLQSKYFKKRNDIYVN